MMQPLGFRWMGCLLLGMAILTGTAGASNANDGLQAAKTPKTLIQSPAVLVYIGQCTGGQDYAWPALTNLGITNVVSVYSNTDLLTQLAGGPWDLVIYDGYYSFLNVAVLDALGAYYATGGRIIFSDSNVLGLAGHPLFTAAGVTIVDEYSVPEPIHPWQEDPLFTTPNVVPPLTLLDDLCNRDGVHIEPIAGQATAHAGATDVAQTNKALLTVDSKRRFIFNGFAPQTVTGNEDGDARTDMVELYENEIHHLLRGGNGTLVYFSECNGGDDYFSEAVTYSTLHAPIVTTTPTEFLAQLNSGLWDLVLVDDYGSGTSTAILDALVQYYDDGGKIIFFAYNLASFNAHPFMARAGATALSTYSAMQPVHDWGTSRLFDFPFSVADLTVFTDLCTTDGQNLQATTGTACAGYTQTVDVNKAAIVLDPHRRLILNGFSPQNITGNQGGWFSDMTSLYVNEINLLLYGGRGILTFLDQCPGSADYIAPALANLGFAEVTRASNPLDFRTHLTSGTWDLVIYESHGINMELETLDALLAYSNEFNPGHMVLSLWDLPDVVSHPLFSEKAGVTVSAGYSTPQPVYPWNNSILFQAPNHVPDLTALSDLCGVDGQYLNVSSAAAQAGYTVSPSENNTAIAISRSKRIIVNGFMPQIVTGDADSDAKDDMVELYENEILYAKIAGSTGVLAYFNGCGLGVNYAETALSGMGLAKTIVPNQNWLRSYLAAGTWGLLIYDNYGEVMSSGTLEDLAGYYDRGGRIILSSWDLSFNAGHPILDRAGIAVGPSYNAVQPLNVWSVSPLFDTPNLVPAPTALSDLCDVDGQPLQPLTATAYAGFTAMPAPDTAAITLDPAGRFLLNGFMPQNVTGDEDGDTALDMVELYQNEVHLALTGEAERQCVPESFLSQRPQAPLDPGANGYYSDVDLPYTACEDFSGLANPIGELVWWGTYPVKCGEPLGTERFLISFCEDAGGLPGTVVHEETVVPSVQNGNFLYFNWVWMYQYRAQLTAPVSMASGWIKIRSIEADGCYWAWLTSIEGNLAAYQEGASALTSDFAFCLLPGGSTTHTADQDGDNLISLSELLRVIQFFNSDGYHCESGTEDDYAPGPGAQSCTAHDSDYNPQDWHVSLSELLRVIQFFNSAGYHACPGEGTEDGYCPGP